VPTGDPEDSQSEGLVIDQELGLLYVALEQEVGILKFSAEPTGDDNFQVIQPIDAEYLVPDIEGLSIYYGANGTGYLLANSQGDSSYAVFSREGTNEYLGSFVVGDNKNIDQVNESDGIDIVNVPLGDNFPNGLMVVQDGANAPQNAVEDEEQLENNSTNFKFVPWESIAEAFPNPLSIDPTSYNPRNPSPQFLDNNKDSLLGEIAKTIDNVSEAGDNLLRDGGSDILTGTQGRDIFVLTAGEGTDTIQDFDLAQDLIGLSDGLSLDSLSISSQGNNSLISSGNQILAELVGISEIVASMFVTV
jgi:hypothetical protein